MSQYNILHRIETNVHVISEIVWQTMNKYPLHAEDRQKELIAAVEEVRNSAYELLDMEVPKGDK